MAHTPLPARVDEDKPDLPGVRQFSARMRWNCPGPIIEGGFDDVTTLLGFSVANPGLPLNAESHRSGRNLRFQEEIWQQRLAGVDGVVIPIGDPCGVQHLFVPARTVRYHSRLGRVST